MSLPAIPRNLFTQQGNGQVHLQWDVAAGATSYLVQRSLDGITFAPIATPAASGKPEYFDTTVSIGTQYFYQVASVNGSGTSALTPPQNVVPTQNGEMSLGEIRTQAQQRADRLNSDFVTLPEWNTNINQSMMELYDLLITVFEDYAVAPPFKFIANGNQFQYPMPNGALQYLNDANQTFTPKAFYKLLGVDLGLNTAANAYVTINKFNFMDRNRFIFPNTASTIYGVFNLQYRLVGNNLEFIPTPCSGQQIRVWYVPRLDKLLSDKDISDIGISGWLEYVITAAIKALQKEEADVSVLAAQKMALIKRIEETAANRDAGQPDHIADVRQGGNWGGSGGWGWNGPIGGI